MAQPDSATTSQAQVFAKPAPDVLNIETFSPPGRATLFTAHPDDIEYGFGGTAARLVEAGWQLTYCLATRGERGSMDANTIPAELGATREAEARAAAAAVGVDDVRFLGFEDGTLKPDEPLLEAMSRVFRQAKPHLVMTMLNEQLPHAAFLNHPDHRAIGTATLDVCLAAGTTGAWFPHLELEEDLPPWRGVRETWMFGPGRLSTIVDISGTLDKKLAALSCHESQGCNTDEERVRITDFASMVGERAGLEAAEGIRRIVFNDEDVTSLT